MKTYSTSAAAKIAQCSPDTIRRACQSDDLKAKMVEGKRGLTWRVDEDALYDWIDGRNREKEERLQEARSNAAEDCSRAAEGPQEPLGRTARAQEDGSSTDVSLAALQSSLHKALEVAQEQRKDRLEAERRAADAEENAFRMARRVQALMHEMESQKRLLSENAESLQKDRAKALEQAAKLKDLESVREQESVQLEELHRHRAEEKARFEKEREKILEELKIAQEAEEKAELARQEAAQAKIELETLKTELAAKEAEWAEQRKPWYQKLFRRSS